jgi:hypothetical protein
LINPGAHRPTGLTDEEWASLARSFALSSTSFLLRNYRTALLVKDERGVIKIRLGRKKAHTIYSVPE